MNDLISRSHFDSRVRQAGGMAEYELTEDFKDGVLTVLELLKTEPSVQPKTGHWIKTGRQNVYGGKEIICSECKYKLMVSPEHYEHLSYHEAFCCYCGAKMEGEDKKR